MRLNRKTPVRNRARHARLCASITFGVLSVSVVSAQNAAWGVAGGGLFNEPTNWVGNSVPTGVATFNNAASGTVTFNAGTTTLSSFRFANDYGVAASPLTFDLTGAYLDLTATSSGFVVGAAATNEHDVRVTGGTWRVRDINVGFFANSASNALTISGGAKVTGPATGVDPNILLTTIFRVGHGSGSNNSVTVTGAGTEFTSTNTGSTANFYIGATNLTAVNTSSGVGNVLSVRDGAVVKMKSWVYLGHTGGTGTFGNDAPNVLEVDAGTFRIFDTVARELFVRDGLVRIKNGGLLEAARIQAGEANSAASIEFSSGSLWTQNLTVDAPGASPISIGDGGAAPAEFKLIKPVATPTAATFADGVEFKSNSIFSGVGTLSGTVTTTPGMKVRPDNHYTSSAVPGASSIGTLRVVGSNWDNTGVAIELNAGNFPLTLAAVMPPDLFNPPVDVFDVNGSFTLGGTVTVDLANYAPPQDQNYDVKVVGWASSIGSTSSMPVSFVNGSPVPYEFRTDGLYLTFAVPLIGSAWNFDGSGSWSVAGNWQGGVPNAADAVANFGTIITSAATVTLDAPQMVGKVNFTSPIAYTLSGATLTIDVNSGTSGLIDVTAGTHTIAAPLVLADNSTISTAAATSLALSGGVTGGSVTLTKSGDGILTAGKIAVGTVNIAAGTLQLQSNGGASGVAEVSVGTFSGAGRLDVTNNGVVINYTSPDDPTPAARIALTSGYAGGAWNGLGIMSSIAGGTTGFGVGYAKASEMGVSVVFGSINVDPDTLIIRQTYNGDSNLDGKVNTLDFNHLAGGFGSVSPDWIDGDYDYDNDVDSIDFNALAGNYGKSLPVVAPGLGSVVPEPASLGVLTLAGALLNRRRK